MPPNDGTLIASQVAGSVGVMTTATPTPTIPPVPARWRGQVNYRDMEDMTGGRVLARSFSQYQARAKARGHVSTLDMPAPVDWTPNPSRGLPDVPWFAGRAIWTWMAQTGKLPPQPEDP